MNRIFILPVLFVSALALFSCSGPSYMVQMDKSPRAASFMPLPGKAALVVVRTTSFGALVEFNTYLDRKLIGVTKGKSYFAKLDIEPGIKYVSSWGENGVAVKVDFKADTVYILKHNVSMGFWKARVVMDSPDAKSLDSGDLEGCTYYEYDEKKPGDNLSEADFKDVIQGCDTLVVHPDGTAELIEYKK